MYRVETATGRTFGAVLGDAALVSEVVRGSSVDAVVTSPPYVLSSLHAGDPSRSLERILRAGADPRDFFGGRARNTTRPSSRSFDYYLLGRWIALLSATLCGLTSS